MAMLSVVRTHTTARHLYTHNQWDSGPVVACAGMQPAPCRRSLCSLAAQQTTDPLLTHNCTVRGAIPMPPNPPNHTYNHSPAHGSEHGQDETQQHPQSSPSTPAPSTCRKSHCSSSQPCFLARPSAHCASTADSGSAACALHHLWPPHCPAWLRARVPPAGSLRHPKS
jgi:hypothetical protein